MAAGRPAWRVLLLCPRLQRASALKARLPPLAGRFLDVVNELGGEQNATPKAILKPMNVEGMTSEQVKSHLQVRGAACMRVGGCCCGPAGHLQSVDAVVAAAVVVSWWWCRARGGGGVVACGGSSSAAACRQVEMRGELLLAVRGCTPCGHGHPQSNGWPAAPCCQRPGGSAPGVAGRVLPGTLACCAPAHTWVLLKGRPGPGPTLTRHARRSTACISSASQARPPPRRSR